MVIESSHQSPVAWTPLSPENLSDPISLRTIVVLIVFPQQRFSPLNASSTMEKGKLLTRLIPRTICSLFVGDLRKEIWQATMMIFLETLEKVFFSLKKFPQESFLISFNLILKLLLELIEKV